MRGFWHSTGPAPPVPRSRRSHREPGQHMRPARPGTPAADYRPQLPLALSHNAQRLRGSPLRRLMLFLATGRRRPPAVLELVGTAPPGMVHSGGLAEGAYLAGPAAVAATPGSSGLCGQRPYGGQVSTADPRRRRRRAVRAGSRVDQRGGRLHADGYPQGRCGSPRLRLLLRSLACFAGLASQVERVCNFASCQVFPLGCPAAALTPRVILRGSSVAERVRREVGP
jgi:hypothetical protein